jgi:serine/threonine protein phosphatase PrpC
MSSFEYVIEIHGTEDRAAVFTRDAGLVVALADGAGGSRGGAAAAQAIIDAARDVDDTDWTALILRVDDALAATGGGETTAVVLALDGDAVVGASVGDSGAWWIDDAGVIDLTEKQIVKPLIGTGASSPFAFRLRGLERGTMVVASDGLFKYAKAADIARVARSTDIAAAARGLVDLVRLTSGLLPDDVAIVLCRR